jgi:hypothetical protein
MFYLIKLLRKKIVVRGLNLWSISIYIKKRIWLGLCACC